MLSQYHITKLVMGEFPQKVVDFMPWLINAVAMRAFEQINARENRSA
jgi:hypothetical protein